MTINNNPKKRRILIVDDNKQIHLDFKKILIIGEEIGTDLDKLEEVLLGEAKKLKHEKFIVDCALQGEEGLKMVKESLKKNEPYAVAFIDVRMPPGWDGIETISRIWKVYPDLQIVICTAYSDYSWEEIVEKFGYTDKLFVLKKPFDNIEVRQLAYALSEKWELTRIANLKMSELEKNVEERTKKLRESEEKYRTMIDYSNDMIWVLDEKGNFLYINKKSEEVSGYKKEVGVGKSFVPIILDEDLKKVENIFKETMKGKPHHYEVRILDSKKKILTLSVNTAPMYKDGKVIGTVSFGRDITKQKQVEGILIATNKKLKMLAQTITSMREYVSITDMDDKIIFVNQSFLDKYGYKEDEIIGKPTSILRPLYKTKELGKKIQSKTLKGGWKGELINRKKDGTEFQIELSTSILKDDAGKAIALIGIAVDIAERKKAEEELKKRTEQLILSQKELEKLYTESEESRKSLLSILEDVTETEKALRASEGRFRDIAINTGDWIWETDKKGCYIYCSPVVKQVLGYEPNKVLGKYFYDFFHPDDRKKSKKGVFEVFKKKEPLKNFINRNVHKDGHTVILETNGIPMLDDKGNLLGYRGVDRDITERVRMDEALRESLQQSELFLDLMSHDLTNINQMTLSSLELMMRDKKLPDGAQRYSKLAADQIHRGAKLISNVKKLTTLTKEELHLEKVDIKPVLESVISRLGKDFPQRDIKVNFKPKKGKWFVCADELLDDIFYNISHNAIKFDRHEKVIVDIKVFSDKDLWRIEFRDRGPGIPDEKKETVFLRARWEGRSIPGSGLGLSLVKAIVERYKGRVWVEDVVKGNIEEGSNFIVLIPKY